MSEDTTKDISSKYDTKPTIEQVLERINEIAESLQEFRSDVNKRLSKLEITLDRTQAAVFEMRADFAEFKNQIKEPA